MKGAKMRDGSPTGALTHVADSVLDQGTIRALAEAVTGLTAD